MLSNEEALRLIKQCHECYVVWATDRNVVVAVHPVSTDPTPDDRFKVLASMKKDYAGPTKGRFLLSKDVTLQTLEDEQNETNRIARRVEIFNSWTKCSIDQLITILVERDFREPMDLFHGSLYIVERLYKVHSPHLTVRHLARLEEFAFSAPVPFDQGPAQRNLQCYLSVLLNEPERLRTFWDRHHNPNVDPSMWHALADAAGDLPTTDRDIIAQLVKVVETPFMFGPRFEAMVALGKIGPPSGQRAVDVILASIYDSSEPVTATRNRVVARIQEPESFWARCDRCNRGYVESFAYGMASVQNCSECLGLAYVPRRPT